MRSDIFTAFRGTLILLFALFLAACAGLPEAEPPESWSGIAEYEQDRDSRAPRPEAIGEELSLDRAIDLALAANPRLRAQQSEADAARADWHEARGKRWPHLSAEAAATRHMDDQRLVPARAPGEAGAWNENLVGADVVLELPLFRGGRLIHQASAARLGADASAHRLGRTREETVFNVTSTFYAIVKQRRVLTSLRASRTTVQRQQEQIQALIAVEKGVRVDLLRVRVRLADIKQQIIAEENRLNALHRLLATQLGLQTQETRLPVAGNLTEREVTPSQEIPWQEVFAHRADYQALHKEASAARQTLAAAKGEYWPQLNVRGAYGGRWTAGTTVAQPGASEAEDVGSIGLHLDMPLFAGGEIRARVRGARAEHAAMQERLRELRLQIRREVLDARDALQADKQRVTTTRTAIAEAEEALDIEQTKYELGKGTIVDVLDAQDALLRAKTNHARALAALKTDAARLELAQGTILNTE